MFCQLVGCLYYLLHACNEEVSTIIGRVFELTNSEWADNIKTNRDDLKNLKAMHTIKYFKVLIAGQNTTRISLVLSSILTSQILWNKICSLPGHLVRSVKMLLLRRLHIIYPL